MSGQDFSVLKGAARIDGNMADLVRSFDWGRTGLGPQDGWPQSLRTAVGLMLASPVPMVLMWGPDGVMIYNDGYAELSRERHPAMLGMPVLDAWPEVADFNADVLRTVRGGGTLTFEEQELVLVRTGRPETCWFDLYYSPVFAEDGRPGGVLAVVVESTARVLARRGILEERERLRDMFAQAPGFMALLTGPDHRFEIVNEAYLQLVGQRRDIVGKTVIEALPEIAGQGYIELLDGVLASGEPFIGRGMPVDLVREPGAAPVKRYVDLVYQPLSDRTGKVYGIFVEGADVTERVAADEQHHLLLREMNHRIKNLFAVVGGMVSATARSAASARDMATTLRGRLDALARANDLILSFPGRADAPPTTRLEDLIRSILEPHVAGGAVAASLDGPALMVGNRAVTNLALLLHETATNAAKYGALSTEGGHVAVDWRMDGGDVRLVWRERGGPPVGGPPAAGGFGSLLARRSVEGPLQGAIEYDWRPEGLVMHARLDAAALAR